MNPHFRRPPLMILPRFAAPRRGSWRTSSAARPRWASWPRWPCGAGLSRCWGGHGVEKHLGILFFGWSSLGTWPGFYEIIVYLYIIYICEIVVGMCFSNCNCWWEDQEGNRGFSHLCKRLQGTSLNVTSIPIAGQMTKPDFNAGGVGEVLCNCRELFFVGEIRPSHKIVVCAAGSDA